MICRYCNTEFEPKKRGRKNTGFCCKKCADNWRQHNVYDLMPKKYTKQCAYCGGEYQTNRKNQTYCTKACGAAAHKTGRTIYQKKCLYCDTEFETLYPKCKYCSPACASRHAADQRRGSYYCEYCGSQRWSDHPSRNRFCSRSCAGKAKSMAAMLRKQEKKRMHEIEMTCQCDWCGDTFVAVSSTNRFCSSECQYSAALQASHDKHVLQFVPEKRFCPQCGMQFTTTLHAQSKIYCSERCEHKAHIGKRAEQMKTAFVEPVGLKTTYRSYEGVCGICGLPVPECNDPASDWGPTVDHIVPISKGGKHRKSNCQLAHRLCNSLKLDTIKDFKIDWIQKLVDEPGRWNERLDTLWLLLGSEQRLQDMTRVPIKIKILATTTLANESSGAPPLPPR